MMVALDQADGVEKLLAVSLSPGRQLYNRNQTAIILPFLVAFRSLQVIDRVNSVAKRGVRNSKSFECPECHFDQPSLGESTLRVQPPQGSIAAACSSHWPQKAVSVAGRFFLRTTDLCNAELRPMVDAARCRNQSISPQFATKRNYSFRSCCFSSCTALVVGYTMNP
ncbi:hypothetical protein BJX62DRAFT_20997 [Aspergillus germanicus]